MMENNKIRIIAYSYVDQAMAHIPISQDTRHNDREQNILDSGTYSKTLLNDRKQKISYMTHVTCCLNNGTYPKYSQQWQENTKFHILAHPYVAQTTANVPKSA